MIGGSLSKKYLFVGVVCIAIALLCIAALATAHEFSVYAIGVSEGAGYDPGFGISGEYQHRGDIFGFATSADFLSQKKARADSGFKYGVDAQGRAYLGDWYLGVGGAWAGYDSKFDDGSHWQKDAVWPVLQTGFDGEIFDAWMAYYFQEQQTENEVSAIKLGMSWVLLEHYKAFAEASLLDYKQAGLDDEDATISAGVGWQF